MNKDVNKGELNEQFRNTLHFCDNTLILSQLPDKCLDIIIEDMPYGTTSNEFDYVVDLEHYWIERLRVIKSNGVIILTAQQPLTADLVLSCRKLFRYELIWEKTSSMGFVNAAKMPLRSHENILVYYKQLPDYYPQFIEFNKAQQVNMANINNRHNYKGYSAPNMKSESLHYPGSVLRFSKSNKWEMNFKGHPTAKPVMLFRWLIKSFSQENDWVFDGYAGRGTTAIACILENRNYICCEWNTDFYARAAENVKRAWEIKGKLFGEY